MFEEVTSIFSNQFCFSFLVLMLHFGACRDNYAGHVHKNIFSSVMETTWLPSEFLHFTNTVIL